MTESEPECESLRLKSSTGADATAVMENVTIEVAEQFTLSDRLHDVTTGLPVGEPTIAIWWKNDEVAHRTAANQLPVPGGAKQLILTFMADHGGKVMHDDVVSFRELSDLDNCFQAMKAALPWAFTYSEAIVAALHLGQQHPRIASTKIISRTDRITPDISFRNLFEI